MQQDPFLPVLSIGCAAKLDLDAVEEKVSLHCHPGQDRNPAGGGPHRSLRQHLGLKLGPRLQAAAAAAAAQPGRRLRGPQQGTSPPRQRTPPR